MMLPSAFTLSRGVRRRILSGAVLCCYLATLFGYPLPVSGESAAEPSSSEQFGNCCCSSGRQAVKSCCCAPGSPSGLSCCQPPGQTPNNSQQPLAKKQPTPAAPGTGLHWILSVAAQKCQGLTTYWTTSG